MKKAVFITAPDIFRDEEYFEPKKILEDNGITVKTASLKTGRLNGKLGGTAESNMLLKDVKVSDFDAIVFVGGAGASVFFDNADALKLAKDFFNAGKVTASICISGVTLANSGILKGKRASVYPDGKEDLIKGGALYTGQHLEIDGNIITADGPDAASDFGSAILKALA
ncbi:MAG: DJ-1/PfpI family protein [Elusimicrobiota bacterium]|jgi:protease I|nr:DJ-1/PfpI family protein [Elusimicrobiota bacterium]